MTGRTWTHPDVLALGVAEGWAETDPARIDWTERQAPRGVPRRGGPVTALWIALGRALRKACCAGNGILFCGCGSGCQCACADCRCGR